MSQGAQRLDPPLIYANTRRTRRGRRIQHAGRACSPELIPADGVIRSQRRPWETRYEGKSVRHWLGALQSHSRSERDEAQVALLEIGSDAAPGLFKIVNQERRSIDNGYMNVRAELPDAAADFFPTRTGKIEGRKLAEEAFLAMGPAAESALPPIRKALADKDSPAHVFAFEVFKSIQPRDPKSIEALIDAWSSDSSQLVVTAGKIGPAARSLVPELIELLHHPYQRGYTLKRILDALQKIDPSALDRVDPGILAEFPPRIDRTANAD